MAHNLWPTRTTHRPHQHNTTDRTVRLPLRSSGAPTPLSQQLTVSSRRCQLTYFIATHLAAVGITPIVTRFNEVAKHLTCSNNWQYRGILVISVVIHDDCIPRPFTAPVKGYNLERTCIGNEYCNITRIGNECITKTVEKDHRGIAVRAADIEKHGYHICLNTTGFVGNN